MRPFKFELGISKNASGSCKVIWGKNIIYTCVYHTQGQDETTIKCTYRMLPFSVEDGKDKISRREVEISKALENAVEKTVLTCEHPNSVINITATVINADASTRCVALNGISLSLAMAGIKMRDLIVGISVGKLGDEFIVDLNSDQEKSGATDIALGILPNKKEVVLIQMDGNLTPEEFDELIDLAFENAKIIYEKQKEVLEKYNNGTVG
jgi:exosome complex component RRP41